MILSAMLHLHDLAHEDMTTADLHDTNANLKRLFTHETSLIEDSVTRTRGLSRE